MSREAFDFRFVGGAGDDDPSPTAERPRMEWRRHGETSWRELSLTCPPNALVAALAVAAGMPGFHEAAATPSGVTLDAFQGEDARPEVIAQTIVRRQEEGATLGGVVLAKPDRGAN